MAARIVLLASWFVLHAIGALGVSPLATCQYSAVFALAVMFVLTGTAHFNKIKHDLARMIPSGFPQPLTLVYITGILEFLGAIRRVFSPTRRLAGTCLAIMLAGLFVANVNAALKGITLRGKPATRLWLRAPKQVFFIWLFW